MKTFEDQFNMEVAGEQLDWKWDEEALVFRATDLSMRVYTLTPTHASLEIEIDEELEIEEDE